MQINADGMHFSAQRIYSMAVLCLKKFFQDENGVLFTDDKTKNEIYGYHIVKKNCYQERITAIKLDDEKLYITFDDKEKISENNATWYYIYGGDVQILQTAFEIAENLVHYLVKE